MDRKPRQNHRCCQARAPSVKFDPLALSACDRDEFAIEADSNLLGIAIAQAVIEAYRAGVGSALQRSETRGAR